MGCARQKPSASRWAILSRPLRGLRVVWVARVRNPALRAGLFSAARFAGFESCGLRASETQRCALGYSQPPASRASSRMGCARQKPSASRWAILSRPLRGLELSGPARQKPGDSGGAVLNRPLRGLRVVWVARVRNPALRAGLFSAARFAGWSRVGPHASDSNGASAAVRVRRYCAGLFSAARFARSRLHVREGSEASVTAVSRRFSPRRSTEWQGLQSCSSFLQLPARGRRPGTFTC
jgi:hypothetical protein